jgi:hypothetical protein
LAAVHGITGIVGTDILVIAGRIIGSIYAGVVHAGIFRTGHTVIALAVGCALAADIRPPHTGAALTGVRIRASIVIFTRGIIRFRGCDRALTRGWIALKKCTGVLVIRAGLGSSGFTDSGITCVFGGTEIVVFAGITGIERTVRVTALGSLHGRITILARI